jgi:hypothetical protein
MHAHLCLTLSKAHLYSITVQAVHTAGSKLLSAAGLLLLLLLLSSINGAVP